MLDRASCERRVYRLATLLTGDPRAAVRVITSVVGTQPDLRHLDGAHLDRLAVLHSREIPIGQLNDPDVPAHVAKALDSLTRQQREAWVFHYVYRLMPRDIARSMDCSLRAVQLHLTSADGVMNDRLGRSDGGRSAREAGAQLLKYSMKLDVPDFYRARIRSSVIWRRLRKWGLAGVVLGGLAAAGAWAYRSGILEKLFELVPV